MKELNFFDCNCCVGMRAKINPGSFFKPEELVSKMARCGIGRALVYHSLAREYDAASGNGMLAGEIRNYQTLFPIWAVMPHYTDDFPEPDAMIEKMKGNQVKAACFFPSEQEHNFCTGEWNCGELYSALERCRIPLFAPLTHMTWEGLHEICQNHPHLRIVLVGVNYRINRNLFTLLRLHPNLYMETSGYKVHQGIEEICRRFGAERLIFGSGMPVYSGAAAVSMINYAKISPEEKRMIASENLERLLKEVNYERKHI